MAKSKKVTTAANLGFEATLWATADKLRNNMDAAEYKHVVLGLVFLKYISDSFEERHAQVKSDKNSDPEDKDEYVAHNVFWVPRKARWGFVQSNAKQPTIGRIIDDAMDLIEKENKSLRGVLPKDFSKYQNTLREKMGELIDLIATIGLGDKANRSKDVLGQVYEYFLKMFASAEGKNGGQFFTPRCVVRLTVSMLAPFPNSRVFDPCCGSGGFFIQSEKFVEDHAGKLGDISVFGQESNPTTWRLAKMNLAIRGIESDFGEEHADSFLRDFHSSLKADFVMANPPFSQKDWGQPQLQGDKRWKYGTPPANNANFGWVQHFISHLAPNGMAGFVLANGSMSSNKSGEGEIRKGMVEDDIVDCMVALPGQLFYSTQIPVCLWFLCRNKADAKFRNRKGETLFIDARKIGSMIDRVHKEFSQEDIDKIASTYHSWRGDKSTKAKYEDIQGYCHSANKEEISSHNFILTPGRYVGAEELEDDDEDFDEKMKHLYAKLNDQVDQSDRFSKEILKNLKVLGYGPK